MPLPTLQRLVALTFLVFLQGCLSSWIRMEDGTVLLPGRSDFALGMSSVPRVHEECPLGFRERDSHGRAYCLDFRGLNDFGGYDWTYDTLPAIQRQDRSPIFGLTWRLGAFGPFGPFTGLELGLHAEAPNNPVTQEFRVALGLPGSDSSFAHSAIAGWGTGAWADNSWFLQYAASRTWKPWRVFGSVRGTLQGTQIEDAVEADRFQHKRTWDLQTTLGGRLALPQAKVLPDWLLVAATADLTHAGLPEVGEPRQIEGFGIAWTSGMGWSW